MQDVILDSMSPKFGKALVAYYETEDLFSDACEIVDSAQSIAYTAVDIILVQRNCSDECGVKEVEQGIARIAWIYLS